MKKVLVIYFTQTGQLKNSVKATLAPLERDGEVVVHYEEIKSQNPFPFPWTYTKFFDTFPETVQGKPCELSPFKFNADNDYDLIIIGYQPWFLSVCIPINTFLKTVEAKKILKGKPVITIIACRNMWLSGQEKMKQNLINLEAQLVGNITFVDRANNLVSLITVLAFVLKGVKKKFLGLFPKYGVSDADLENSAPKFGEVILRNLKQNNFTTQQNELNKLGATVVKPNLLLMEGRGAFLFPIYADYISKKGTAGNEQRKLRVRIFGIVLPIGILILSPIITIVSRLMPIIFPKKFRKEIEYYSQNTLR